MLIISQFPEATKVAGYKTWKSLGREVKPGEKAIWIKAPVKIKKGLTESTLFRFVPVFDISQTQGRELPEITTKLTTCADKATILKLTNIAYKYGFAVNFLPLRSSLNGDCSHLEKLIRINSENSLSQQIKTLIHELAHALGHEKYVDVTLAEIEAESVAYIVCSYLGIDSSCYSSGYLLGWGSRPQTTIEMIKASGQKIQVLSNLIISEFEKQLFCQAKDRVA